MWSRSLRFQPLLHCLIELAESRYSFWCNWICGTDMAVYVGDQRSQYSFDLYVWFALVRCSVQCSKWCMAIAVWRDVWYTSPFVRHGDWYSDRLCTRRLCTNDQCLYFAIWSKWLDARCCICDTDSADLSNFSRYLSRNL